MSRFYKYLKESYKYSRHLQRIDSGGGYGHLANLFDNVNFTFSDIREAIVDSLSGNLEYVKLKTDGQNLLFTWKDNQLLFARNKTQLKNFGANALTTKELAQKFEGRGAIEQAYNSTAVDLQNAIQKLSDKQREKIFKNGKKFMSVEVMYTESENIVHYGANELRFHGTKEYNEKGEEVGDNKEDGRVLAGMIKQVRQDKQGTFEIKSLEDVDLPKIPDFDKQVSRLTKQLDSIRKRFRLPWSSTILDYKEAYFEDLLDKKDIPFNQHLINRWAKFDKSYSLKQIKKDFSEENVEKIREIENNMKDHVKDCVLPLEKLILDLGATALKNVNKFMVLHPEKSMQKQKAKLEDAINQIRQKGTPAMIKKLELELDRLQSAGGVDLVTPEEGITFIYKGGFYKLTGQFASYNQIINLLWQLE